MALVFLSQFCFAQSRPIQFKAGTNFTITLRANMSTGYQWQIAEPLDETMLELVNTEYIPYRTQRLGADGKQLFTFKALKAGETTISFKYAREGEKEKPPEKTQVISISIK
jgi:inhibitor of cysteine peptidase